MPGQELKIEDLFIVSSGGSGTNATAVFQPCNRAYYIELFPGCHAEAIHL